jgi:hypothetical protein
MEMTSSLLYDKDRQSVVDLVMASVSLLFPKVGQTYNGETDAFS